MRKFLSVFLPSILIILSLITSLPSSITIVHASNAKPSVIPSLREWTGGTGNFTLTASSRICVDPTYSTQLSDTAAIFREDLIALSGTSLSIVNTSTPAAGDFYLTLNCSDTGLGTEGYLFEVGSTCTIRAKEPKGAFYGTRTVLQILKQDPGMNDIPQGTARDYPKWKERGFMLDVGRMFFNINTLRDYVKFMSWYKMNDFQLHLNDYSYFRLESTDHPGLSAAQHYTKTEFTDLQNLAKKYSLTITPEIDTPFHAEAFTKYRPDLTAPESYAQLDIFNPDTQPFMNGIWDEYIPLFQAEQVHMGMDEYLSSSPGANNKFREYMNANNRYIRSKGKVARMWGELDAKPGTVAVDKNIIIHCWYTGYYNPQNAVRDGYSIINTTNDDLYIVPKAGYFHDYLNTPWLYANWEPWYFGGPSYNLSPTEPKLLGGMFCVWNDLEGKGYNEYDVYDRVKPAMQTLAEKLWSGVSGNSYDVFFSRCKAIGNAPGTNLEAPPVPGNIAHKRPAYSSSNETGYLSADMAFDNSYGTRWSSQYSDPQWIYVDLGQSYNVNRVKLNWEYAYGKSYKIQVSDDAVNWIDVYSTTAGDGGTDDISFPARNGRYVRMYGTQRGTSNGYSILEFQVFEDPAPTPEPGSNLALNKTAAASSNEASNFTPDKAVDGSTTTRWSSGRTDPQWIYVDLGHIYNINRVKLNWEVAYGKSYKIQVSNDALTWTDVYSTTTGDGGIDYVSFTPANARYVRMYGTQRGTEYGYSLFEFQVYPSMNLAANKSVKSSSNQSPTFTADKAVDGSMVTRWSSQYSDPQWIYVDLGQSYVVNRVLLNWEAAYGKGYKIQISNDALTWTDVYSTTAGDGGLDDISFSPVSARYVRMYGTQRGTAFGYSLFEFQVFDRPNLALNKISTSSSNETSNFTPDKAVDCNSSTRWSSLYTVPQWIRVDLGQTYSINRVKLNWEYAYGKSYKIQVSFDGANWTDVYSTTTGDGGTDDICFAPVNARYVRMHGTQGGLADYGFSIFEFEVYSN